MPAVYATNDEKAWLVVGSCRRFNERLVQPKRLGFNKIDAMLGLVGRTLPSIELKLNPLILGEKIYHFNTFIPSYYTIRIGAERQRNSRRACPSVSAEALP
jgi:hypothetical protein